MSTTLAPEKEAVTVNTKDGDHDKFQHYFERSAIEANLLDGTPMTALCGKVLPQQSDPQGKTVCHDCQEIYDNVVGMNLPNRDGRDA